MNRKSYQIGPGAASLMLIVVVLSMSVLGMLSMVNSRSDNRLSIRSAEVAEQAYQLSSAAEQSLANLDAVLVDCAAQVEDDAAWLALVAQSLPENMSLSERVVRWTEETENGREMICAVELAEYGAFPRTQWMEHRLNTQLEEEPFQEATWEIWF